MHDSERGLTGLWREKQPLAYFQVIKAEAETSEQAKRAAAEI